MSNFSQKDIDKHNEEHSLKTIDESMTSVSEKLGECADTWQAIYELIASFEQRLKQQVEDLYSFDHKYLRNPRLTSEQEGEVDRFCENQENAKRELEYESEVDGDGIAEYKRDREVREDGDV